MHMAYRGDFDGLRALAVISVVLFHFDYLDGGFVGVDIFFVISGFLITKLIHDEVEAGSFSIANFYERRMRRIFPALFVVYAVTGVLAFFYCFSFEADFVGKALLSSIFFVSNIFFYRHSGYFEGDASVNPLLHTWSLSVEEQFYIVLPLLLMALGGMASGVRKATLAGLALVSFLIASLMLEIDQSAAFFLMQYRGWELLLGSLLAVGAIRPVHSQRMAELVAGAGLALVIASVAAMTSRYPFPGYGALAPCLGAALLIHAGTHWSTRTSRFLSTGPMRFIGLISYSLYLWHYPIKVFYKHIWGKPTDEIKLLMIVLSIAVAATSWRFIETPFRRKHPANSKALVFGSAAACVAVLAVAAVQIEPTVRLIRLEPPQVTALLTHQATDAKSTQRDGLCFLSSKNNEISEYSASECLRIEPGKLNFLIMGDSHAAHFWSGFSQVFPQVNFMQATASGCRMAFNNGAKERCTRLMDYVFNQFLPGKKLDGIILAGRWRKDDIEEIRATVERLRPKAERIIVFGPIVEYTVALPRILALEYPNFGGEGISAYRKSYQKELDQQLGIAMQEAGIEYVSIYRTICAPECTVWLDKEAAPMQSDYGHLTPAGAREVARRIRGQLFPDVAAIGK